MKYGRIVQSRPGLYSRRAITGICIVLILGALLAACAEVRKVTYPPGFVYLERKQVVSRMAEMSLSLRRIDEILRDNLATSSEQQAEIIVLLNRIDDITDELGAGNVETNHLLIDAYVDAFKVDLQMALRNASADPPNYFALGRLAGSCTACHRAR